MRVMTGSTIFDNSLRLTHHVFFIDNRVRFERGRVLTRHRVCRAGDKS